uniref:Uncharacterized protein n=1 Tax=Eptatretus burgeri TaxID=7764 RepID=A0A8C4R2X6_EPTBU
MHSQHLRVPDGDIAIPVFLQVASVSWELDRLNSCLDTLEAWSDSLNARLRQVLETSRQERQQAGLDVTCQQARPVS